MEWPRLVVTGMGAVSPIGLDVETFWENLVNGVSGIGRISSFDPTDMPIQIAGEVKGFDPIQYMPKKRARRLSRSAQFALVVAQQALNDSGYEITEENAERTGVAMATGGGGIIEVEKATRLMERKGPRSLSPFVVPNIMPNAVSCQISIENGIKGPVATSVAACASGNYAFMDALRMLRLGEADILVVGGVESTISPVAIASLARSGALSVRNDDPTHASRPFDKDRDGFVFAEGGAAFIIETEEHARRRRASIYVELVGGAITADAYHITAPAPGGEGAARAIRKALADAHVTPEEVDLISAHATSTRLNDVSETAAIKQALGAHAYDVAITATKSMVGHALGGAGAFAGMAAMLALYNGVIPPTINLEEPDPECDLDYVPNVAREKHANIALVHGFGFGGQNAVIVFRRWQG